MTSSAGPCSTTIPAYITATSSLIRRTTCRSCEITSSPTPRSRWSSSQEVLERHDDGAITRARFEPPECWKWGRVEAVSADGAVG